MEDPTVCRMVHYVSHGSPVRTDGTQTYTRQCRAAIITEISEPPTAAMRVLNPMAGFTVGLCVLNPSGLFFHSLADGGCAYDVGMKTADWSCDGDNHEGGTWHWPVRADL